jgi:hypothetical protein
MAAMAREIFHPHFLQTGLLSRPGAFDRQRQKLLSDRPQSKMMHTGKKFQLTILRNKIKIFMAFKVKRKKRIKKIERWSFLGSGN